jgi:predicted transposase YbfD/YdcC
LGYVRCDTYSKKNYELAKYKKISLLTSLKENQKNLLEEVKTSFSYFNTKKYITKTKEKSAIITKTYEVLPCNENTICLKENLSWRFLLKTLIKVKRFNEKTKTYYIQYYVSNKSITAKQAQYLISGHWRIENKLHQNLDRSLKEDNDKSCKQSYIKSVLKTICLNILHKNKCKKYTETVYKNALNIQNILNLKGFI